MNVISLGAGVQSTAMALMAARGEITPMPDCAIFADTGWEPKAVYDHLAWLMSPGVLPFPVHVVSAGNIREDLVTREPGRFAAVPFFMIDDKGKESMGRRQCTHEYKLKPLMHKQREMLGVGRRDRIKAGAVTVWVGISTDEAMRMKPTGRAWQVNRWPLIENSVSRRDCLAWLAKNGYPTAPKSSCIGCPFHSNAHWRDMKINSPAEWADAVAVDMAIRDRGTQRFSSLRGVQYMHPSKKPLDQVDLSTAEDRGQLNLFINECEGMCGV